MQTIEIKPNVLLFACQKAEEEGKSVTDFIDGVLRVLLRNGTGEHVVSHRCHNCKNPIDYEINSNKGYCDYCESVVFFD